MSVYETINMKLPIFTLYFLSYLFISKDLILIFTSVRIRMIYCYNDYQSSKATIEFELQDKSIDSINNGKNDTTLTTTVQEISIYDIRTKLQRNLILAIIAMIAFLLPFCDTVYVAALYDIVLSLNTSTTLVATSISIYLSMSGIFSLVWGAISDRFGRKITLIVALIIFIVATIICIFAPTIAVLIVFRTLEGATISVALVVGQSLVADIFPEEKRGMATGAFFLPFNIGPIVGPVIGGPLSYAFGWRSTFIFLTICSFIAIVVTIFLIPETHQYFAMEHFHKTNPNKRIIDAQPTEKPSFEKPWKSLVHLIDLTILPYMAIATTAYCIVVASSALFSIFLAASPYNYTEDIIGYLYIPSGVVLVIGSIFGGWISDKANIYFGQGKCLEGRLVPALGLSILIPIGLIIYGWIFDYKLNVMGPIIGMCLISFGQAAVESAVSTYLTSKKQSEAAAVIAANTFFNFFAAGIVLTCAVPMYNAMGIGPYFSLLAGLNIITIVWSGVLVYKNVKRGGYVVM